MEHKKEIMIGFSVILLVGVVAYFYFNIVKMAPAERDDITTAERQAVLTAPSPTANSDELGVYEAQVARLAKESGTLTVGANCAMDPLVLKFRAGAKLNIINTDISEHTVAFEDQNFFNVAPGMTRILDITQTFTKGPGIYRYSCNDLSLATNVGVMYIVK